MWWCRWSSSHLSQSSQVGRVESSRVGVWFDSIRFGQRFSQRSWHASLTQPSQDDQFTLIWQYPSTVDKMCQPSCFIIMVCFKFLFILLFVVELLVGFEANSADWDWDWDGWVEEVECQRNSNSARKRKRTRTRERRRRRRVEHSRYQQRRWSHFRSDSSTWMILACLSSSSWLKFDLWSAWEGKCKTFVGVSHFRRCTLNQITSSMDQRTWQLIISFGPLNQNSWKSKGGLFRSTLAYLHALTHVHAHTQSHTQASAHDGSTWNYFHCSVSSFISFIPMCWDGRTKTKVKNTTEQELVSQTNQTNATQSTSNRRVFHEISSQALSFLLSNSHISLSLSLSLTVAIDAIVIVIPIGGINQLTNVMTRLVRNPIFMRHIRCWSCNGPVRD